MLKGLGIVNYIKLSIIELQEICNIREYLAYNNVILILYKSSSMDQYKLEYEKGSGTFSVVFTAISLKTGKHVAIKCMKKKF